MFTMSIFTFHKKIKYQYEDIKSNKLILHHHLGLGDHLTCNGLVNYLTEIFNEIYLPVFEKNYNIINFLYKSNKKVKLFIIKPEYEEKEILDFSQDNKLEILRVGFEKLQNPIQESFYNQLGLSYKISSDYFKLDYDAKKNNELENHLKDYYECNTDYSVAHIEGSNTNFEKTNLKINSLENLILVEKKSDKFNNIFYYLDIFQNAKEVHCINSSFFNLAERIPTNGKLFFHDLKKEKSVKNTTSFLKDWKIVDYY